METIFNKMQRNFIAGTLWLGRLAGVVHHTGIIRWDVAGNLQNRFRTIPTLYAALLTTFHSCICIKLLYDAFISLRDNKLDILGKMDLFAIPSYYLQVFLTYVYFLTTATRLTSLLKEWNDANKHLESSIATSYWNQDIMIVLSEMLTPMFLVSLGIVENIVYDLKCFNLKSTFYDGKTFLEKYFYQSGFFLVDYVPSDPVLSILFFTCDKAGVLTWNFGGLFVIVFCRLCTQRLRLFGDNLRTKIGISMMVMGVKNDNNTGSDSITVEKIEWEKVRVSFISLCNTLQKVANYVAPLVLLCYTQNIYEIILDTFLVLSGNLKTEITVSIFISVFQLVLRLSLITYHVSEMQNSFMRIGDILSECPGYLYEISTQRLERFLDTRPVGVYLFGSFLITRKFFISIISFIFTTEIILMQSMTVTGTGRQ